MVDIQRIADAARQSGDDVVVASITGSRLYGTARPDSDHDVFLVSAPRTRPRHTIRDGADVAVFDIATFARSISIGASNALDVLWSPPSRRGATPGGRHTYAPSNRTGTPRGCGCSRRLKAPRSPGTRPLGTRSAGPGSRSNCARPGGTTPSSTPATARAARAVAGAGAGAELRMFDLAAATTIGEDRTAEARAIVDDALRAARDA